MPARVGIPDREKPAPENKVLHRPITDFMLFAQEPHYAELADVLEQWREWTGAGKALQLAEDMIPYKTSKPGRTAGRKERKTGKQSNR